MFAILDAAVCLFWILTYLLVLIGTIKCKYPLISPISQLFFGTNEFAVLLFFLSNASDFYLHVIVTYLCWAVIEIAIFIEIMKTGMLGKGFVLPYICFVVMLTILLFYLISAHDMMTFICYFNACCGVLFWLRFICKENYPFSGIALAAFICKAFGDFIAIFVNIRSATPIIAVMAIMLPIIDVVSIILFLLKHRERQVHLD